MSVPFAALVAACLAGPTASELDADNPIRPNAKAPFGMEEFFADAPHPEPSRVRLGRWLFYDQRLSNDQSLSCATCHRPDYAFSEPTPVAIGIGGQRGRRKTPSIINLAARTVLPPPPDDLGPAFFGDGRVTSLEDQVLVPIADPVEMGLDHRGMVTRLSAIPGYRSYFREAFSTDTLAVSHVASALADYVRSRQSGNSPFDRWSYARDAGAVTEQAKRGYDIFSFKARCGLCHTGFNFSDGRFYNLGVGWDPSTRIFSDEGRAAVSHQVRDRGAFKTPGLRDVARHAPYMHDGSLPDLRAVVEFYNRGGIANPNRSARLAPLGLTPDEIDAVVAFLQTLNGEGYQDRPPAHFPR